MGKIILHPSFVKEDWHQILLFPPREEFPKVSGVYIFETLKQIDNGEYPIFEQIILYVGSSKSIHGRYARNPIISMMRKIYDPFYFHYKPCENYKEEEIRLIKAFKPLLNSQHNHD